MPLVILLIPIVGSGSGIAPSRFIANDLKGHRDWSLSSSEPPDIFSDSLMARLSLNIVSKSIEGRCLGFSLSIHWLLSGVEKLNSSNMRLGS